MLVGAGSWHEAEAAIFATRAVAIAIKTQLDGAEKEHARLAVSAVFKMIADDVDGKLASHPYLRQSMSMLVGRSKHMSKRKHMS